jgi:hypothetical protein
MSMQKVLPLSLIIQGSKEMVPITHDHLLYAVDLVVAITKTNRNYAAQVLNRLFCEF